VPVSAIRSVRTRRTPIPDPITVATAVGGADPGYRARCASLIGTARTVCLRSMSAPSVRLPVVSVASIDASKAPAFEPSIEARVALTEAGYAAIAPLMDSDGASVRSDLYVDAWDGETFRLAAEAEPCKLRLKRKLKDGEPEYEISISFSDRAHALRNGAFSVTAGESTTIELSARDGKGLFRLGEGILGHLHEQGTVSHRALKRFDRILRKVLRQAELERLPETLGDLDAGGLRLVPSHLNTKRRLSGVLEGGEGVGDVEVLLGETFDTDPVTGAARTRYELEAEPASIEGLDTRKFLRVLTRGLGLDTLSPRELAGDLRASQERTLALLNGQPYTV
jgi:hypothetical protein